MRNGFNFDEWKDREERFEAVFKALQVRDFEKAGSLVPKGYKLCGYQEFNEAFKYENHSFEWADQFEVTHIAPGLYPVFTTQYYFNEKENSFTNVVNDFQGICFWYKGNLIASTYRNFEAPYIHTIHSYPYAHSVAKEILEGNSKVNLLAPFKAEKVPFEYNRESHITYHIIDKSISPFSKINPIKINHPSTFTSLNNQINNAKNHVETYPPKTNPHGPRPYKHFYEK